jgi:DNA invertase Pin-like site-specific DNA recombinase
MPTKTPRSQKTHHILTVPEPPRAGRLIGYVRTSTTEQKLDLQFDALKAIGVELVFQDQVSGATTKRPGLSHALKELSEGDTLTVWKLDRLGRSLSHLVATIEELKNRGVGFRSLTEGIDTQTATGRLMLGIFGSLAEFERSLIAERISAGRQSSIRRGVTQGRKPKLTRSKVDLARRELEAGQKPADVARNLGVGRSTMYASIAKDDEKRAVEEQIAWTRRGSGRPRKSPQDSKGITPEAP